jgi:hypothetical protein
MKVEDAWAILNGQTVNYTPEPNLPVDRCNWNEAMAFCKKATEKTGKWVTLPTEAQWEYAARAGTTNAYYTGSDDLKTLDEYEWYIGNEKTHPAGVMPVGQKKPNPWGLYDILGNCSEWTLDFMPIYPTEPTVDPHAPVGDQHYPERGLRATGGWGGFNDKEAEKVLYRCDDHVSVPPDYKMDVIRKWKNRYDGGGFRVIVALEKPVEDAAGVKGSETASLAKAEPYPGNLFPIVAWGGPDFPQTTDQAIKDVADANFNTLFPGYEGTYVQNKKVLDLGQKHGIRVFITEKGYNHGEVWGPGYPNQWPKEAWGKRAKQVTDDYSSHPALAGYYLYDEPSHAQFYALKDMVAHLRTNDSVHPAYINLYPVETGRIGIASDEIYYSKFATMVKPAFISYDNYPFMRREGGRPFFYNMEMVRSVAVSNNIPFWGFALSEDYSTTPEQLEGHIAYQMYNLMAYGAKGLQYFLYWARGRNEGALVDLDGNKRPSYFVAKKVNAEIKALGPTLLKLKTQDVYHTGDLPRGTKALESNGLIDSVDGAPVVVGLFKDAEGAPYAMITSKDPEQSVTGKATVGAGISKVEVFDCGTGQWEPVTLAGKGFQFSLTAGRGRLYRLTTGK